ncbi:hypothetical protein NFI96_029358 [Prochilodus magdalenae]|nr:hypothetical protein NFI96_029358 [Prochilodus magdalenae]
MGPFGALLWISHYLALFVQLNASQASGNIEVDNHISGNAFRTGDRVPITTVVSTSDLITNVPNRNSSVLIDCSVLCLKQFSLKLQSSNDRVLTFMSFCFSPSALFTEVPHDIITQSGEDVEMACSFRGAGSSSVSLEIQWWYLRHRREWTEKPAWSTNQVAPVEEITKDATKISVVKVAGSNISHRLRLSSVKPADEGIYECRVIDFSDNHAQHHRVRAYLQVQPPGSDAQLYKEDQQLLSGNQFHSGEQNPHHGSHHAQKERERDEQNEADQVLHHGDHKLHNKEHHRSHHGEANDGEKKDSSSSAVHYGEHHRKDHQHLHEVGHQQVQGVDHREGDKHTQASKKSQAKAHHSEVKGHKVRSNDCSADDCVLRSSGEETNHRERDSFVNGEKRRKNE